MKLHFQKIGKGPALIILHGLYGMSDNWITFARELSVRFTVYLVDQRNHGRSHHDNEHTYLAMSLDLQELVNAEGLDNVIILGHSMGGKTAMVFATQFPEKIAGLIIVDIAPVNYSSVDSFNSQVIIHLNIVNAMLAVDFSKITGRLEIDDELKKTIKDDSIRQFILKNVHRNKDGTYRWKLNIKAIGRYLPDMMNFPKLKEHSGNQLVQNIPVLFIRGGRSGYVSPEYYEEIKSIYPKVAIETIPNAGHWVHAEQPIKFMNAVKHFLAIK